MSTHATTLAHPCTECDGLLEPELVSIYPSSQVCLDCMPKSERTQLEKDLNQVQQLDRALLPNLPVVNGWDVGLHYRPSRLLSGDFYDVREEGDGRLTIVVGDVMGKGIPAALLRTGLQGSLKALAPEVCSPAKVLEKANRHFLGSASPGRLATVFFRSPRPRRRSAVLRQCGASPTAGASRVGRLAGARHDRNGPGRARQRSLLRGGGDARERGLARALLRRVHRSREQRGRSVRRASHHAVRGPATRRARASVGVQRRRRARQLRAR